MATATAGRGKVLDLRVLGPLEVVRDGASVTIPGHKARTLLACLVANDGHTVSRDRLIDAIWGEKPPKSAVNTLHTYVTHLRTALDGAREGIGSSVIGTHPNGYRLELADDQVDSWRLEKALAAARIHSDRREFGDAAQLLSEPLDAWRGPPLEEFLDADFARAESSRLQEVRLNAEELRTEALIESGQENLAVPVLEILVEEHPYRERLWEHLMLALFRAGRQTDALNAYRRLNSNLAEIGLEPGRDATALESRIFENDPLLHRSTPEPVAAIAVRRIPLPADSFIGRARELEELEMLCDDSRLVTITGIGGTGKSRLGIQHATQLDAENRYVDLSAVTESEVAEARLVEAFGLNERPGPSVARLIAEVVGNENLVLLVDNAEEARGHIGPVLLDLLASCPGLSVLVTSREPLGLEAERTFPVGPMALGSGDDAEKLFMARAQLTGRLSDADSASVSEVCRAVNGIPAALEVIAAAGRAFSLPEVAENLSTLIDGDDGRQSITAALQWSYGALTPEQQDMFRAACLFPGGVTFDALTAVVDPDTDRRNQLADIGSLVERSLLGVEGGTPRRYRVLEVFRRHVLEWIDHSSEDAEATERFVTYFAAMAGELEASFGSDRWQAMLERVDDDEVNLAHAIDVALRADDPGGAYRIAGPLARYWRWRGRSNEGLRRLQQVSKFTGVAPAQAAKVQRETAATLRVLGRFAESRDCAGAALELYEDLGEDWGVADVLYDLALADVFLGSYDTAMAMLQRSVETWKRLDERSMAAFPMIPLAWLHTIHGDYETAEAMWTSILTNVDTALFPEHSGITFRVAELALVQGQTERARKVARDALETATRARYPYHEAGARAVLAHVSLADGDLEGAAREATLALRAANESGNAEGAGQALLLLGRLAALNGQIPEALRLLNRFKSATAGIGGPLISSILAEFAATIDVGRERYMSAARLHGAAQQIRANGNLPLGVLEVARKQAELDLIRDSLGRSEFESAFEAGRQWHEAEVAGYVGNWFE